ncbi:MAG TPA: hypothetical protein VGF61_18450 [Candidatus Acidoferrum sp.]|jgi:hypothetical protein
MSKSSNSFAILILKGNFAGLLFAVGSVVSGMLAAAVHVTIPNFNPATLNQQTMFLMFLLACPLLGLGLVPLAYGIRGSRLTRWLALALFLLLCLGVNTIIEMRIFTVALANGGAGALVASFILPAILCALLLATISSGKIGEIAVSTTVREFFAAHSIPSWLWRFILAIFAFPLAYLIFGMMVAPFVVDYYRHGIAGLILPPMSVILPTQMVRSTLFLIASLPFIVLWKKSRGSLIFSLGLAHWLVVGLFGLVQALWFPPVLRIAHSLEIGGDSFAYAAAIAFLLFPRSRETRVPHVAAVAHELPS